jgi:uncharacterized membrane protein YozB (DUF420 family)
MTQVPGFIPGSRASFMMDLVVITMILVLPCLLWSIFQVHYKKRYTVHKKTQLILAAALFLAVGLFELDVRLYGWRDHALASPYYNSALFPMLSVHLFFAISTFLLWITVLFMALRYIPSPSGPSSHSKVHRRLGKLTVVVTICASFTGWIFYWMAFVAA